GHGDRLYARPDRRDEAERSGLGPGVPAAEGPGAREGKEPRAGPASVPHRSVRHLEHGGRGGGARAGPDGDHEARGALAGAPLEGATTRFDRARSAASARSPRTVSRRSAAPPPPHRPSVRPRPRTDALRAARPGVLPSSPGR